MRETPKKLLRKRRSVILSIIVIIFLFLGLQPGFSEDNSTIQTNNQTDVLSENLEGQEKAAVVLERLEVKGRAPKTGYSRSEFSDGWGAVGGCDMRNIMLARGMSEVKLAEDACVVLSGILFDPYTGESINFMRGSSTSDDVQIDHVVALSDAWQKGAQNISQEKRFLFANDPLNLLAVDGSTNQEKGDSDAASWLPPNKNFRCQYVARQIAVKDKYKLWITEAEKSTMKRTLNGCGEQVVPLSS
jgi:hypothetical protein